jgi:hypothetical protein
MADGQFRDVRSDGELAIDGGWVAAFELKSKIAGAFVPHFRRFWQKRGFKGNRRWKRLVIRLDQLPGILHLLQRFRDDESHSVADMANLIDCKDRMRRDERNRVADHHRGHKPARQAPEAIPRKILGSENGKDARRGTRRRRVYSSQTRVRMRRADDVRISHVGQLEVVDIAALSGQESRVLDPAHGRSDPEAACIFLCRRVHGSAAAPIIVFTPLTPTNLIVRTAFIKFVACRRG